MAAGIVRCHISQSFQAVYITAFSFLAISPLLSLSLCPCAGVFTRHFCATLSELALGSSSQRLTTPEGKGASSETKEAVLFSEAGVTFSPSNNLCEWRPRLGNKMVGVNCVCRKRNGRAETLLRALSSGH